MATHGDTWRHIRVIVERANTASYHVTCAVRWLLLTRRKLLGMVAAKASWKKAVKKSENVFMFDRCVHTSATGKRRPGRAPSTAGCAVSKLACDTPERDNTPLDHPVKYPGTRNGAVEDETQLNRSFNGSRVIRLQ
eukprot:93040-Pyramimonas_sp.AAC.1